MSGGPAERLYRLVLRLYPRSFRAELGDSMLADFRALLADGEGRRAKAGVVLRELVDLLRGALSARGGADGPAPGGSMPPRRRLARIAGLGAELRGALRGSMRRPGAGIAAVVSLALALGAVTAVFSVVRGVILEPLPYRAPQQLAFVWDGLDWVGIPRAWVAPAEVVDLREGTTLFAGFAAISSESLQLTDDDEALQVPGGVASANLFELLGVEASLGRTFRPGEDAPGAEPVVVLTWGLWHEVFGADPWLIGRTIELDGVAHTVVGVLPREIDFLVHSSLGRPQTARLWTTLRADLLEAGRDNHNLAVLARVRDGVTLEQARAELATLSERIDREHYRAQGFAFRLAPLHRDLVSDARSTLWLLLGAAGFLLLLAASNTATLLLARAEACRRDLAVRVALGARGWRLFASTLVESVALAAASFVGALAVARLGLVSIRVLVGDRVPRMAEVGIDAAVVAASGITALVVALACATLAMTEMSRRLPSLAADQRGAVARRSSARRVLVAVQMASALVLGVGSVLLVRTLWNLERTSHGFEPAGVVTARLVLAENRHPEAGDLARFADLLLDEVRAIPGVVEAGLGSSLPLSADTSQTMAVRGDVDPESSYSSLADDEATLVDFLAATPGYLEALGVELTTGRWLAPGDGDRLPGEQVAVVDERLADGMFGGAAEALGRSVRLGGQPRTVVGVVRHVRMYDARGDHDRPQMILAYPDRPFRGLALVVAAGGDAAGSDSAGRDWAGRDSAGRDPAGVMEAVRAAVRRVDPAQPVYDVRTFDQRIDAALAGDRLLAVLVTGFGAVAFSLAAVGVLGLLGVLVAQRRGEVGLRVALGAGRREVAWLVLRQTAAVALPGIALGLAGALALRGVLATAVYGVGATDPAALGAAAAALVALALVASGPPLLRALRVDPARTLREES